MSKTNHKEKRMGITPAALAALVVGDMDNFMTAATPGGIEAQEKAGQTMFVANSTLPKDLGHNLGNAITREQLTEIGFQFGEDADDIFVHCCLPEGWSKKASDHSMWSYLLDQQGRRRAEIFYKAAFYDRSSHLHLCCRYGLSSYENGSDDDHYRTVVLDCGKAIHEFGESRCTDYQASKVLEDRAVQWLDTNHPQWRDPFAYWDSPA